MNSQRGRWLIKWRPLASEDLQQAARYIGRHSPGQARAFREMVRAKVGSLVRYPELGRPTKIANLRELVVHPNYIVIYRLQPEARIVRVLRVKHAAQQEAW